MPRNILEKEDTERLAKWLSFITVETAQEKLRAFCLTLEMNEFLDIIAHEKDGSKYLLLQQILSGTKFAFW